MRNYCPFLRVWGDKVPTKKQLEQGPVGREEHELVSCCKLASIFLASCNKSCEFFSIYPPMRSSTSVWFQVDTRIKKGNILIKPDNFPRSDQHISINLFRPIRLDFSEGWSYATCRTRLDGGWYWGIKFGLLSDQKLTERWKLSNYL